MENQVAFQSNKIDDIYLKIQNDDCSPLSSSKQTPFENCQKKKTEKCEITAGELLLNLTSTLDGLFSKIDSLKETHGTNGRSTHRFGKKNMDVSKFPMPNLCNNQFLIDNSTLLKFPSSPFAEVKKDENNQNQLKKTVSSPNVLDSPILNSLDMSNKDSINQTSDNNVNSSNALQPSISLRTINSEQKLQDCDDSNLSNIKTNKNDSYLQDSFRSNQIQNCTSSNSIKATSQPSLLILTSLDLYDNENINNMNMKIKKTHSIFQDDNNIHKNIFLQHSSSNKPQTQIKINSTIPQLNLSRQINDELYKNSIGTNNSDNDPSLQLEKVITKQTNEATFIHNQQVNKEISLKDFQLGKLIGSGKFGDVHICRHKKTGFIFALKKIFKSTIKEYAMVDQFIKQLRIHSRLNHPNIIKFYCYFDDEYHLFLLMQYADSGILMDKLKCSQDLVSQYIDQIIDAVDYLHKSKITHRDIKPENIVLQFGNTVKLCDFGWATYYENQMRTTFCGTWDYISPQMKQKGEHDNRVDIWSIGVLTYQLLTGTPPHRKELTQAMKPGKRKINWNINYPPYLSTLSQSFIRNLLKQNPEQRASLRYCSSHTFIRKYKEQLQDFIYFEEFSRVIW